LEEIRIGELAKKLLYSMFINEGLCNRSPQLNHIFKQPSRATAIMEW
jgi:hypothetical protein